MNWTSYIKGFEAYLLLERSMSPNSIDAYKQDIDKLENFIQAEYPEIDPPKVTPDHLSSFITTLNKVGLGARSQARILSGVKAFYKYLLVEDVIDEDPTDLLEGPKLSQKIPEVLSYEEISQILDAIDMSKPEGHRNRAMLETLYASGLRVSELIGLRLSLFFPEEGYIKVIGKGNKERIVPIGNAAIKHIHIYIKHSRSVATNIQKGHEDIIFLNRRGKALSRVMVFHIIKNAVAYTDIEKNVSPHTFRHSFATHLVEGGADLRAIQQMLGHESITTTEIYTHLDTSYLRETIMNFHPSSHKKKS